MRLFPWPWFVLATLAGCGDSRGGSETEPAQGPRITEPVREADLAATPPAVAPLDEAPSGETARAAVPSPAPTFPGLAETPGGPAPGIADVVITLERTWCLGTCPVYTVRVRGDGSVRYEGSKHVLRTEPAESRIDPARLEPILRELEALDYLRHEHRCRMKMRDSPGTGVTLVVGKTSRRFVDMRYGRECGQDATSLDTVWHANVDRIGKLIDEAVGSEQWIGTPAQRAALPRER